MKTIELGADQKLAIRLEDAALAVGWAAVELFKTRTRDDWNPEWGVRIEWEKQQQRLLWEAIQKVVEIGVSKEV